MASFTQIKERWYYSFIFCRLMEGTSVLLIPFFIKDALGEHLGWVGIVAALTSVASVPSSILCGYLSDTLGRRKVFIILGFVGSSVAYLSMGFAQNILQLCVLSAIFGAFFAASGPVSSILIMETHNRDKWDVSFGKFNKVGGLAFVVGLLTCGAFLWYSERYFPYPVNLRAAFILFGGTALGSALSATLLVPEPRRRIKREAYVSTTGKYLGHTIFEKVRFLPARMLFYLPHPGSTKFRKAFTRPLLMFFLSAFLAFAAGSLVYTVFPLFLKDQIGLAPAMVFVFYLARNSASALAYQPAGHWSHRFGFFRVQRVAIGVRSAIFFLLALVSFLAGFPGVVVFILVLDLCSGPMFAAISVAGSTIAANLSTEGLEGEAVGTYNAIIGCAQISGAVASGFIVLWLAYGSVFLIASSLLLLSSAGLFVAERARPSSSATPQSGT